MVRNEPPKCTLLSSESAHMEGTKTATVPDTYKVDGFVACSKFLKGFELENGDEVIVHPDMATLKQSCEANGGWSEDKEEYIVSLSPQDVGTVGKHDWVGEALRVQWRDGHWWSFPQEALAVRLASLPPNRRQFLTDGSDEWVLWSKKVQTVSQEVEIKSTIGGSENIVKETKRTGKEVLQDVENEVAEALAKDADAAEGKSDAEQGGSENIIEEIKLTVDDEEEDEENEENEDDEDDDDDDHESDGSPGGGRRLNQAKEAAEYAMGFYKFATSF